MTHRIERFTSTLKQALAEIISSSDNPQFKLLFITDVIVSPDLKRANIFITSMNPNLDGVIAALTHAKPFFKRQLAGKMYLKFVPELVFLKDAVNKPAQEETVPQPME